MANEETVQESQKVEVRNEVEELDGIDQASGNQNLNQSEISEETENQDHLETEVSEIEKLRSELEETKLNWARERADFSNYRKRMIEEMRKARALAVSEFARSLMSVVDNLDLVLMAPAENPEVKNFVVGVNMIRQEFLGVLSKEGIRPEVEVGADFDPYLMEAIELEEKEGQVGEKVEHVYKKAYVQVSESGERLVLRPARVKVVRAKKSDNNENQPEEIREGK